MTCAYRINQALREEAYPPEVDALITALGQLQQCQEKLLIQARNCDATWSASLIEDAAQRVEYLQDDIAVGLRGHYPNVDIKKTMESAA